MVAVCIPMVIYENPILSYLTVFYGVFKVSRVELVRSIEYPKYLLFYRVIENELIPMR
jgi:hypothetical protein